MSAAPDGVFSDLATRTASGLLIAALALAAFYAGVFWTAALVALAASIMLIEARAIALGETEGALVTLYVLALAGTAFTTAFGGASAAFAVLTLLALAAAARDALAGRPVGWSLLFTLYLGLASIFLVAMRLDPEHGFLSILWLILVVVATDVGAYAAGRAIGGPKLWPRVSPKKTWAGLAGGVALAAATAALFSLAAPGRLDLAPISLGATMAVAAQAGDLAESAFKRRFGVKDSGVLIPGHGGVFDRLDGVVSAAILAGVVTMARDGAPIFLW